MKQTIDNDFAMAYEVIIEDLVESEMCSDLQSPSIGGASCAVQKPSQCELDTHLGLAEDSVGILEILQESENSDMWLNYPNEQDGCLPGVWEEILENEYNSLFTLLLDSPKHSICKKEDSKSSYEMPSFTGEADLTYQENEDVNDLRVECLNLKRRYFTKDFTMNNERKCPGDSLVHFSLKAKSKIKQVKVYLNQWKNLANGMFSPLELQTNFSEQEGLLTVDLNHPSFQQPKRLNDTTWQLYVIALCEDGASRCSCSSLFQIQQSLGCIETQTSKRYGTMMHRDMSLESMPSILSRNRLSSIDSDDTCGSDSSFYETAHIVLLPRSKINIDYVVSELAKETDVVHVREQPGFPGMLKVVKRTTHKDVKTRRRANGFRSAEEAFEWVCGFCLFKRRKKSTVKSHVRRNVCRKNRRILAKRMFKAQRSPRVPTPQSM